MRMTEKIIKSENLLVLSHKVRSHSASFDPEIELQDSKESDSTI